MGASKSISRKKKTPRLNLSLSHFFFFFFVINISSKRRRIDAREQKERRILFFEESYSLRAVMKVRCISYAISRSFELFGARLRERFFLHKQENSAKK